MATFRKRNGKWQVQVRKAGASPVSRSFTKRSDAQTWALVVERQIETADFSVASSGKNQTLLDVLQRYEAEVLPLKRSPEREVATLRLIGRSKLALKTLRHITADDFAKLRDDRLRAVKASTVKRQFNLLRHALRIALEVWEWPAPYAQIRKVSLPICQEFHVARVTNDTFDRLMSAAEKQSNPYIGIAICLALRTGMRRGELLALSWEDVDLSASTLLIRRSKNGRSRSVPFGPSVRAVLSLLAHRTGSVLPISANCLRLGFERARKSAAVDLRFHDLRHEAISRLFELGLTVPEAQLVSGHRTMSQLSRYAHPDVNKIAEKLS